MEEGGRKTGKMGGRERNRKRERRREGGGGTEEGKKGGSKDKIYTIDWLLWSKTWNNKLSIRFHFLGV